jgi:hypothetical protein
MFENLGWAEYSIEKDLMELTIAQDFPQIDDDTKESLIAFLNPEIEIEEESPETQNLGVIIRPDPKRRRTNG